MKQDKDPWMDINLISILIEDEYSSITLINKILAIKDKKKDNDGSHNYNLDA